MAIVTLDEAKAQLGIPLAHTDDDLELQGMVDAIGGVVDDYTNETVELVEKVEESVVDGVFRLWHTPVASLVSVESIDGATTWDVANLHASRTSGLVTVLTGSPVRGLVVTTYEAGYEPGEIPGKYTRGALIILQHVWETQRGATGTARGLVVGDDEIYDPRSGYTLPRRGLEWLGGRNPVVA